VDKARMILIVSILATGAKVSVKSAPGC